MNYKLIILFAVGVLYRLWLSKLVPQPFVFDATEYHNFAVQILNHGLTVWPTRLYGYPLFLSIIYKIFGVGNLEAVGIVQAALDSFTAYIIYKTGEVIFKNNRIAVGGFILYLFNPFTATFTALVLSETLSVFLFALVGYLSALLIFGKKLYLMPILGLVAGYFPQVRPVFLFFSLILMVGLISWQFGFKKVRRSVINSVFTIIFFVLPFTYNIIGNYVNFKSLSPTNVDNLFVREFYISLYVPGRSPFHANNPNVFPVEVRNLYNEYSVLPKNNREREEMARKYLTAGVIKVKNSPSEFVVSRLSKFWYVWEKHFLYYYAQPENRLVTVLTYWGNNLLLFSGAAGFIIWLRKSKSREDRIFAGLVIAAVFYVSLVHSISLAEERYSLPVYSLFFLFAGYAIIKIFKARIRIKI